QPFDQRELQEARPRPELADRQRIDGLKAVQEPPELFGIQSRIGMNNQIDSQQIDASMTDVGAACDSGQLCGMGGGQMPPYLADFRRDQVEVVDQPTAGGRDELTGPRVFGEDSVVLLQKTDVIAEPWEHARDRTTSADVDSEVDGERLGALLELLEAEQFVRGGPFGWRRMLPEWPPHGCGRSGDHGVRSADDLLTPRGVSDMQHPEYTLRGNQFLRESGFCRIRGVSIVDMEWRNRGDPHQSGGRCTIVAVPMIAGRFVRAFGP